MEVSSHALALDRTLGTEFDVGVFTNLTQDHLDFHGTLDAYFDAKVRPFHGLPRSLVKAVRCGDQCRRPVGDEGCRSCAEAGVVTFGIDRPATASATQACASPAGIAFQLAGRAAR